MGLFQTIKEKVIGFSRSFSDVFFHYNVPLQGSDKDFADSYAVNLYVNTCIRAIAQEVARAEFMVEYRLKPQNDWQVKSTHPVLRLLDKPNQTMSQNKLFSTLATHEQIFGRWFLYVERGERRGYPQALYPLDPTKIVILTASYVKDKDEQAYLQDQFEIVGFQYTDQYGRQTKLSTDDVIFHLMDSPHNLYASVSPVQAGYGNIRTDYLLTQFQANSISNNAIPSGIINLKQNMNEADFQEFKKQFKQKYGGVNNAGSLAIIKNSEIDFTKIGNTLGDIQFENLRKMSRDDILSLFRVPKTMIGISEDVNRATAETAIYMFMRNVIQPLLDTYADTIQRQLMKEWKFKGEYKLEAVNVVPDDLERKHKIAQLADYMTLNDKREFVGLRRTKDPEADRFYQPSGLLPYAENKTLVKQIGTTIKVVKEKAVKKVVEKIMASGFSETKGEDMWRQMIKINDKYEPLLKTEVLKLLNAQKDNFISNFIELDNLDKRGLKTKVRNLLQSQLYKEKLADVVEPIYQSVIREQGQRATALVRIKGFPMQKDFDPNSAKVRRYIASKVAQMAKSMSDTTEQELVKIITTGFEEGTSVVNIAKNITESITILNQQRSEIVARTEIMRAAGFATRESYDQSDNVKGYQWYTAMDERTCEFCNSLHNKVFDKGSTFFKLGDTLTGDKGGTLTFDYEDIEHPPIHCQCRCDLLPVTK